MRKLRRSENGPLIVRVADLFAAEPDAVSAAAGRLDPRPTAVYVARTAAGTVLTLEQRLPGLRPFRRVPSIRNLQAALTVIRRELESDAMALTSPATSDRSE